MKLIGYTVDLTFTNTPSVQARVAVADPVTGEERTETMHFVDDDARAIVAMVPNPRGTGLVVDPDGKIDQAKLKTAIAARVAEVSGGTAATTLAARVAAAEEARRAAYTAQEAVKVAEEAKAKLDAEIAEATKRKAAIEAEIAKAAPKPAEPVA